MGFSFLFCLGFIPRCYTLLRAREPRNWGRWEGHLWSFAHWQGPGMGIHVFEHRQERERASGLPSPPPLDAQGRSLSPWAHLTILLAWENLGRKGRRAEGSKPQTGAVNLHFGFAVRCMGVQPHTTFQLLTSPNIPFLNVSGEREKSVLYVSLHVASPLFS